MGELKQITFRASEELYLRLEGLAAQEGKGTNEWVRCLVTEYAGKSKDDRSELEGRLERIAAEQSKLRELLTVETGAGVVPSWRMVGEKLNEMLSLIREREEKVGLPEGAEVREGLRKVLLRMRPKGWKGFFLSREFLAGMVLGGLLSLCCLRIGGWNDREVFNRVDGAIHDSLRKIFNESNQGADSKKGGRKQ